MAQTVKSNQILLLLPDSIQLSDPTVITWMDTAGELGIQLQPVKDSEFLGFSTTKRLQYSGLIVPDTIHRTATDAVVEAIKEYAASGGEVMLVYDAGLLTAQGSYYVDPLGVARSRFSDMVGVNYQLYLIDPNGTPYMEALGPVTGLKSTFLAAQFPPGKCMDYVTAMNQEFYFLVPNPPGTIPFKDYRHEKQIFMQMPKDKDYRADPMDLGPGVRKAKIDGQQRNRPEAMAQQDPIQAINGYIYGVLQYPVFVTQGTYSGTTLLSAPQSNSLAAGYRSYGSGRVFFVNLPLGHLKSRTDGLLMHGLLYYFSVRLLKVPYLSPQPQGVGGLVLNWHVDYGPALAAIDVLDQSAYKIWDYGTYSIDITAGPDTISFGDNLGLNVPGNTGIQAWIRSFIQKGHQVGCHGGWIHDYFGDNANDTNPGEFQKYLEWNKQAIEKAAGNGYKVTEYSSPQGNNPLWTVDWMEQNGIKGYYFAGAGGMPPTRPYRSPWCMPGCCQPTCTPPSKRIHDEIWAFPVATYGDIATFDEFQTRSLSPNDALVWLKSLVQYVSMNRLTRLIYFHPPAAAVTGYPEVVKELMEYAKTFVDQGTYKWYTMVELSQFLTSRLRVEWMVRTNAAPNSDLFDISRGGNLRGFAWILSKDRYDRPTVQLGSGTVQEDFNANQWIISITQGKMTSEKGQVFQFTAPRR